MEKSEMGGQANLIALQTSLTHHKQGQSRSLNISPTDSPIRPHASSFLTA